MANLEQVLEQARELPRRAGKIGVLIDYLTLLDLGSGYAATFAFESERPPISELLDWYEQADNYPYSAVDKTAAEAIQKAIAKVEAELSEFVKKNFRYSPEIQKEFIK